MKFGRTFLMETFEYSNVRILIKEKLLIKTSEVLLVCYKLIYSRFIGLVQSLKINSYLKEVIKNSENRYWIYSK